MTDVLVIGGGINGLVAAVTLARAKRSVTIVDRGEDVGGAAASFEIAPGFHVPVLSHALTPMPRPILRHLKLDRAGFEPIAPDPALTAIAGGAPIVFHRDPVLTAASIARVSERDAGRWREFLTTSQRIAATVAAMQARPAPAIDDPRARDLWQLAGVGRRARALGRTDRVRLVRWLPMSIADILDEWFESDRVKAAIAAHAIFGHLAGPRSGGTGALFLQRLGEDPMPVGSGLTARGGPAGLARTLAAIARQSGVDVRTGARVARIDVDDGRARGVTLESGDRLEARVVVAAIDPRQVLAALVDPSALPPTIVERARHIRARGVTAKVNYAIATAPAFAALDGDPVPLRGRLLTAAGLNDLERAFDAAKYGAISPEPWLEISIPSVADASLAPTGQHVMSVYVHFAPRHLAGGAWPDAREALGRRVTAMIDAMAPGFARTIVAQQVITPEDLERAWGLPGGHIFHGERTLDQMWIARPLLGWARHRTPVPGLYLASAGTHPGGGANGASGWLAAQAVGRDLKRRVI